MSTPLPYTLITGASSGIGREIAIFLSKNQRLILGGRDVKRLEETQQACANYAQHILWPFDLANIETIDSALRDFLSSNNVSVQTFVHCAGIIKILPMRNMDCRSAREIININLLSAAEIIRILVTKKINHQQLKNVVFVSSIASRFGTKGFNLYSASKGGLNSLMRSLSVELAPQVRVNSVLPGGILTDMTSSLFNNEDTPNRNAVNYPLGSGHASDIASAVEFIVSEKARWITGQEIVVDGGRTVNITD